MRTDGVRVWSYGWYEIAFRLGSCTYVAADTYSRTTARHVSRCRSLCSSVTKVGREPQDEGRLGAPNWEQVAWQRYVKSLYDGFDYLFVDGVKLFGAANIIRSSAIRMRLVAILDDGSLSLQYRAYRKARYYFDEDCTLCAPKRTFACPDTLFISAPAHCVQHKDALLSDVLAVQGEHSLWYRSLFPGVSRETVLASVQEEAAAYAKARAELR